MCEEGSLLSVYHEEAADAVDGRVSFAYHLLASAEHWEEQGVWPDNLACFWISQRRCF